MDEKPKSIWKKSWTGRRALPIWGGVVGIAVLLAVFIAALGKLDTPMGSTLQTAGIIGIGIVIVCLFIIYFLVPIFRWLFWKHWRRTFFALACLATLIALFYAEEDWRGKRDWGKFKSEWEAKGEKFDWQSIVPPSVPDDKNFAFSPVWIASIRQNFWGTTEKSKSWYGDRIYDLDVSNILSYFPISVSGVTGTNFWSSKNPKIPAFGENWTMVHFVDLKIWQNYYRDLGKTNPVAKIPIAPQSPAADVLLALGKFDPVIEQLRQDSARPDSRFPLQYDGMPAAILLPHLAAEKQIGQVLQLHAVAELQNGESEKALGDVKLMLRLTDASRTEPFLICHLVRIAILNLALQPIWEGLAEHKWSDVQLADLDSELAKLDFLADYKFAIRGERALEIANIEFLRHPHGEQVFKRPRLYFLMPSSFSFIEMLSNLSGDGEEIPSRQIMVLGFGPSGWIDQNELRIARFETKWYLPIIDENAKTISQAKIRAVDNALGQEIRHRTPENVLETLLLPALGGAARKCVYAQSSVNLARGAIALERYHIAHGEFPESLDALAQQFLEKIPHDIIGGQPLKYRRTDDGQFILYSVGWNERDDGGVVVFGKGETPSVDTSRGDWVWRYPQK